MKGFDMNKKVVIVGVCVNIFVLVKMNSKLNQTKKVTILTSDLLSNYIDLDMQKDVNEAFEEIVENYED